MSLNIPNYQRPTFVDWLNSEIKLATEYDLQARCDTLTDVKREYLSRISANNENLRRIR